MKKIEIVQMGNVQGGNWVSNVDWFCIAAGAGAIISPTAGGGAFAGAFCAGWGLGSKIFS